MTFRELLPAGDCPPADAEEIVEPIEVYRLVRTDPPTDADFRSQRCEHPRTKYRGVTECRARGVSVYTDSADAAGKLALPQFKGRMVCRVTLDAGAGWIEPFGRDSHHTWWPLADFAITQNCVVE